MIPFCCPNRICMPDRALKTMNQFIPFCGVGMEGFHVKRCRTLHNLYSPKQYGNENGTRDLGISFAHIRGVT